MEDWDMRRLALYVIATVVLLSGCQRDISGTYMTNDKGGVWWLQLVRTPDNHLTGQLTTSLLGEDGKVQRNTVSVTGAVDAEEVTISSTPFGFQVFILSGTLDRNKLTLTGMGPTPIILKRADLSDYQRQVNSLNAQSGAIVAAKGAIVAAKNEANARLQSAKALQYFVSQTSQTVEEMQSFDSEVEGHLSRLPSFEAKYRAVTERVADYVSRERQSAGDPRASVARGQLGVAANQAAIETYQLHNSEMSFRSSLEGSVQPLIASADGLERACRVAASPGELTPAQDNERTAACQNLSAAIVPFRKEFQAIASGLAHAEQVYVQERSAQQGLLQSANRSR